MYLSSQINCVPPSRPPGGIEEVIVVVGFMLDASTLLVPVTCTHICGWIPIL